MSLNTDAAARFKLGRSNLIITISTYVETFTIAGSTIHMHFSTI